MHLEDGITEAWLAGCINPAGEAPAVLLPVYTDRPGGNSFYFQDVDHDGRIRAFRPADVRDLIRVGRDDEHPVRAGDEAWWGLHFGGHDIHVDRRSVMAELLRARRPDFAGQAFFYLSAARVLGDPDEVDYALRGAYEQLRRPGGGAADIWRDIVALPSIARQTVLMELLPRGIAPTHSELAGVDVRAQGDHLLITLPGGLYRRLAESPGALQRITAATHRSADTLGIGASAMLVAVESRDPEPPEIQADPKVHVPMVVVALGAAATTSLQGQMRPGALGKDDREPPLPLPDPVTAIDQLALGGRVSRGRPRDTTLIVHLDPDAAAGRAREAHRALVDNRATDPGPPQIVVLVFGFGAGETEAAGRLAAYYRALEQTVVGVFLRPEQFAPDERAWLSSKAFTVLSREFSLLLLSYPLLRRGARPYGRGTERHAHADQVGYLMQLIRAIAPARQASGTLWKSRTRGEHIAVLGQAQVPPTERLEEALGHCLAQMRNEDYALESAQNYLILLTGRLAQFPAGSRLYDALAHRLPGVANRRSSVLVARAPGRRSGMILMGVGLKPEQVRGREFEDLCEEILIDSGAAQIIRPAHLPVDFVLRLPAVSINIICKYSETPISVAVMRDIVRTMQGADGGRAVMTNAVADLPALELAAQHHIEIVHYRDARTLVHMAEQLYETFLREHVTGGFEQLSSLLTDALSEYLHHAITAHPDVRDAIEAAGPSRGYSFQMRPLQIASLDRKKMRIVADGEVGIVVQSLTPGGTGQAFSATFRLGLDRRGLKLQRLKVDGLV